MRSRGETEGKSDHLHRHPHPPVQAVSDELSDACSRLSSSEEQDSLTCEPRGIGRCVGETPQWVRKGPKWSTEVTMTRR